MYTAENYKLACCLRTAANKPISGFVIPTHIAIAAVAFLIKFAIYLRRFRCCLNRHAPVL